MKTIVLLTILSVVTSSIVNAQQIASNKILDNGNTNPQDKKRMFIDGVGTINSDQLKSLNTSGKFGFGANIFNSTFLYGSFNKGALVTTLNSDSLAVESILFPEAGTSGLSLTLDVCNLDLTNLNFKKDDNWGIDFRNYTSESPMNNGDTKFGLIPSIDFAFKKSNVKFVDSLKTEIKSFSTQHWVFGVKLVWEYHASDDIDAKISFYPYYNVVNIMDEDLQTFRDIFNEQSLKSHIDIKGIKITAQVNQLSFFADIKYAKKDKNIKAHGFSGTTINIGTAITGDLLRF